MWIISVVSLVLVAFFCLVGVFHTAFKDNLLQCVGMGGLCIACCGRANWIFETEITQPSWMLVHLCMAIYALGTAKKVAIFHGREVGWRWLLQLDHWVWKRRTAAGDFDDKPHWIKPL